MQSDELAERVEEIRDTVPPEVASSPIRVSRKYADAAEDLLSVLDDVAEGIHHGLTDAEFEGATKTLEATGHKDAAETLGAVRDLHLRREGE